MGTKFCAKTTECSTEIHFNRSSRDREAKWSFWMLLTAASPEIMLFKHPKGSEAGEVSWDIPRGPGRGPISCMLDVHQA